MRTTLIILTLLVMSSCVTKKKCIEKYCTTKTADTTIVIHDTTVIESTHTDTVFSSRIDSIFIQQGKLSIKYIKVRDSIFLSGKYDADTIIRTDTVRISLPCPTYNCNLTAWEWIKAYWMWVLLALVVGCIIGVWVRR